jgi:hypothetical protein
MELKIWAANHLATNIKEGMKHRMGLIGQG